MASSSVWRSAVPLVAGRSVSALVGLALPAILAKLLDAASYGTYKQLYLIANLTLYSLQLGLAQSLLYFVPRARERSDRRGWIGQTQQLMALLGVIAGVSVGALTPLLASRFSNPQLAEFSVPLGALAGFLLASTPFELALTASGRSRASALALIGSDLVRVGAMTTAVLAGGGVKGLAWAASAAAGLRWVVSMAVADGAWCDRPARTRWSAQLAYALPFGVASLAQQQQIQWHQLVVAARTSPAQFALYAVGCMQIPIVSLLYAPVSESLQVKLARVAPERSNDDDALAISDATRKLARVFLPLCALLIATARPGIVVLYGAAFEEAAPILRIAVLSLVAASLPVDALFKARALHRLLLAIYAAKLALTWPALLLGFHAFGMLGAIGAHVAVEFATRTWQLLHLARELERPASKLIGGADLRSSIERSLLGGSTAAAVAWAIGQGSPDRFRNLVACAGASIAMMAVVLASQRWNVAKSLAPGRARAA